MATYTNEELYYKVGEEIVRFGRRKANRQKGPVSFTEMKVKWDRVNEMN